MNKKRQIKNRSGVALFVVLFVMVFLGILMVQFFANSQHAQRTAHKFYSSEIARQLAAAGQEEAFTILHQKTDNPESKEITGLDPFFQKIVDTSQSLVDETNIRPASEDEGSKIDIHLPITSAMANKIGMEITAFARVIDFRKTDMHGYEFYGNEGIGTIEIVVNVKAKAGNEKKAPGSCNMIRHHDFRVVCILSKERPSGFYVQNSILDYALFIKKGQKNYEDVSRVTQTFGYSSSVNPGIQLEINAGSNGKFGKVNLGSGGVRYQELNISSDTLDLMDFEDGKKANEPHDLLKIENDSVINAINPSWRQGKAANVKNKIGIFKHYRVPLIKDFCATNELRDSLQIATLLEQAKIKNNVGSEKCFFFDSETEKSPVFYDGIVIKPFDQLKNILTSDVRKQFLNYSYFYIDLSQATVEGHSLDEIANHDSEAANDVRQLKEAAAHKFSCYNYDIVSLDQDIKNVVDSSGLNYKKLTEVLKDHGKTSQDFTCIHNSLPYAMPSDNEKVINSDDFIRYNTTYKSYEKCYPENIQYPYAHYNLWNKRSMTIEKNKDGDIVKIYDVDHFGIYDKTENKLYLRGVNHSLSSVVLGDEDNPNKELTIVGSGVLIATGIKINCGIKKDNPNSVCVLHSRNGNMIINTDKQINAALICMGQPREENQDDTRGDDFKFVCNKKLDLVGSLAIDEANFINWAKDDNGSSIKHTIEYDPALYPDRDVYSISINKSITFERVMEKE